MKGIQHCSICKNTEGIWDIEEGYFGGCVQQTLYLCEKCHKSWNRATGKNNSPLSRILWAIKRSQRSLSKHRAAFKLAKKMCNGNPINDAAAMKIWLETVEKILEGK